MPLNTTLCGSGNPHERLAQNLAHHGSSTASGSQTRTTTAAHREGFRTVKTASDSQALEAFIREPVAQMPRMTEQPPHTVSAPKMLSPRPDAPQRAHLPAVTAPSLARPITTLENAWDRAFASLEAEAQAKQASSPDDATRADDVFAQQPPSDESSPHRSLPQFDPEHFGFVYKDALIDCVGDRVTLFYDGYKFDAGRGSSMESLGEFNFKIEVDQDGRCSVRIGEVSVVQNGIPAQFVRPVTVVPGKTDIASRFQPTDDELTTAIGLAQQGRFICSAHKLMSLLSAIKDDSDRLRVLRALRRNLKFDVRSDLPLILSAFGEVAQSAAMVALFPPAVRAKL